MTAMNSTFTLYTTDRLQCEFNYPNLKVSTFNATELLMEYGFQSAFPIMDACDATRFTRISDILRICLAHKFQQSYLDTDVTFLHLNKIFFERAYVGAAVWMDKKNAIEITNAAFCLPRVVLTDMVSYQVQRILTGGDEYFYTEMGPSMFHKVQL